MNIFKNTLSIKNLLNILPHRYPFLLIDKVLDIKNFKYLKALKNCTFNEPFFLGHFTENPIFPGVLVVEAMAQAAGILIYQSTGDLRINESHYFVGIDNARFKKNIIPGDQIFIEVFFLKSRKNIIKFKSIAIVNHITACRSIITFSKKYI